MDCRLQKTHLYRTKYLNYLSIIFSLPLYYKDEIPSLKKKNKKTEEHELYDLVQ
jgi:hypothetical protein